jgi:hypothetical protein
MISRGNESGYYNSSIRNTVVDLYEFARGHEDREGLLQDQPASHRDVGGRTRARDKNAEVTAKDGAMPRPSAARFNDV